MKQLQRFFLQHNSDLRSREEAASPLHISRRIFKCFSLNSCRWAFDYLSPFPVCVFNFTLTYVLPFSGLISITDQIEKRARQWGTYHFKPLWCKSFKKKKKTEEGRVKVALIFLKAVLSHICRTKANNFLSFISVDCLFSQTNKQTNK